MTINYSLDNVEHTSQDIINYITESMKKVGCGTIEIEEYKKQARKEDINGLISLSQEYVEMLNNMDPRNQECKVSYLW